MKTKLYELIAEDLTHLGGPMGSEYTTRESLGLFGNPDLAKLVAEEHYHGRDKIKWESRDDKPHRYSWYEADVYRTQDLGYVQYHILERTVTDG